jgi:hypothetical protein
MPSPDPRQSSPASICGGTPPRSTLASGVLAPKSSAASSAHASHSAPPSCGLCYARCTSLVRN